MPAETMAGEGCNMVGIVFSVVFVAIKAVGIIDWSWWWLAPAAVAAGHGLFLHYENRAWRGF